MKEFGCEKMWYFICFITGAVVASAIILFICNRRINRANTEIAALRTELSRSASEVERARTTISNIRRTQSSITDGLIDGNKELHSVIERLSLIRDKVQNIEDELNFYYSINSDNNDIHDSGSQRKSEG